MGMENEMENKTYYFPTVRDTKIIALSILAILILTLWKLIELIIIGVKYVF